MSRQRKIQQDSLARDFVLPGIFGYPSPVSFFLRYAGGQLYLQVANPRSTAEEVARLLHTNEDGVSHLVTVKLLKPVGHPTGNKQKFFCTEELLCLMRDRAWLGKVTDALYAFNEQKNAGTQRRNLERQAKRGPATPPPPKMLRTHRIHRRNDIRRDGKAQRGFKGITLISDGSDVSHSIPDPTDDDFPIP